MTDNQLFYKKLQKHETDLVHLLANENLFQPIPDDWHIFVVDIENSTGAVKKGLHHEVNLSATGSIAAVLNEIKKTHPDLRIPYFFGGDGTTFIIPDNHQQMVSRLLENYRMHVKQGTNLYLKVGSIPVREIYQQNRNIKIAKLTLTSRLTIPIVLGTGLKYAEELIKASFVGRKEEEKELVAVNLIGLECRWDEIKPALDERKIVCLLANCPIDEKQAKIYGAVLDKINSTFGSFKERQPISSNKMRLDLSFKKIIIEMKARFGKNNFWYLIKNWIITIYGKYYFQFFEEGKKYVQDISLLSDTLMIDGSINTVFSGTQANIDSFVSFLDQLEKKGNITYGIHVTHSSIMSCYIEDRKTKHIHFVDGTEGGYTSAAKMYKSKSLTAKPNE